jgi:hypothetical protein
VTLEQLLPDWAASQEEGPPPDYRPAVEAARELAWLDPDARREEIGRVSRESCYPNFDLAPASGLYVVLRLLFDLPDEVPLDDAKVFGGWLHPSIGQDPYDLSWPVHVDVEGRSFSVDDFRGYRGRGYDALGEHDYFAEHFPLRSPELLEDLKPA